MDKETKAFEKFLIDWAKDTQDKVKAAAPIKTGLLRRSILIGTTKRESVWRYKLEMVFYGKFQDEGTRFIKAKNFTAAFKDLKNLIPKLTKEFAKYTVKNTKGIIEDNNKNNE